MKLKPALLASWEGRRWMNGELNQMEPEAESDSATHVNIALPDEPAAVSIQEGAEASQQSQIRCDKMVKRFLANQPQYAQYATQLGGSSGLNVPTPGTYQCDYCFVSRGSFDEVVTHEATCTARSKAQWLGWNSGSGLTAAEISRSFNCKSPKEIVTANLADGLVKIQNTMLMSLVLLLCGTVCTLSCCIYLLEYTHARPMFGDLVSLVLGVYTGLVIVNGFDLLPATATDRIISPCLSLVARALPRPPLGWDKNLDQHGKYLSPYLKTAFDSINVYE
jgi:hypothetical protein